MSQPENQVATTSKKGIKSYLEGERFKQEIAKALPRHLGPDRFIRVALTAMTKTPLLGECTPESFFQCLLQLSSLGLEPDGRRAHLIPFKNKKKNTVECTLIIDWKGLAELAMRSGIIASLHADVICENDDFEWNLGEIVHHRIDWKKPRGEAYAAYATAKTKDGARFCQVMTRDEIIAIRDASQGWYAFQQGWSKSCPWDPEHPVIEKEMWKKTPFRRLTKWLPLSAEFRDALDVDEKIEPEGNGTLKPVFAKEIPAGPSIFTAPAPEEEDNIPMGDPEPKTGAPSTPPVEQQAAAPTETPLEELARLCEEADVKMDQVFAYAKTIPDFVSPGRGNIAALPKAKLLSLINDFGNVVERVREMEAAGE